MNDDATASRSFHVCDRVFFWTGRRSYGYGVIREIKHGRALIDPEPHAHKGSDFWIFAPGSKRLNYWGPRDFGVRFSQLNTPPNPWHQNN